MGHYDDVIEAREAAEFKARADKLGMTVEALAERDRHDYLMQVGRRLYEQRVKEQEQIDYYLKHNHE